MQGPPSPRTPQPWQVLDCKVNACGPPPWLPWRVAASRSRFCAGVSFWSGSALFNTTGAITAASAMNVPVDVPRVPVCAILYPRCPEPRRTGRPCGLRHDFARTCTLTGSFRNRSAFRSPAVTGRPTRGCLGCGGHWMHRFTGTHQDRGASDRSAPWLRIAWPVRALRLSDREAASPSRGTTRAECEALFHAELRSARAPAQLPRAPRKPWHVWPRDRALSIRTADRLMQP